MLFDGITLGLPSRSPRRIHHGRQIRHSGPQLALDVLLPSYSCWLLLPGLRGGCSLALVEDAKTALPGAARGWVLGVAPRENTIGGCGMQGMEVGEEVTQRPSGMGWRRRRVEEGDCTLQCSRQ